MNDKIMYKLNDDIYFRKCDLFDGGEYSFGDCTKFSISESGDFYTCAQLGLHFHCPKHMGEEMYCDYDERNGEQYLFCSKCQKKIYIGSLLKLEQECLSKLNSEIFKDAKLVRLDDWYIPEIKSDKERISDYWVKTEVKTDKDGDTMIVIYVGNKNTDKKAQLFIKPEKLQLSNDYKDMDLATVLPKIELTLKDRIIIQQYDN